jgi:hypothetical protein
VRLFDLTHLVALGTTLAVECGLVALAAWAIRRERRFAWRAAAIALAVNLVSHTLFWRVYPWLAARDVGLLEAELSFTLGEAVVYWRACPLPFRHAWLVALIANFVSFLAGGLVFSRIV